MEQLRKKRKKDHILPDKFLLLFSLKEIVLIILSFLSFKELKIVRMVNSFFETMCNELFKKKFLVINPESNKSFISKFLKKLSGIKKIELQNTKVSNSDLKFLKGIEYIDLDYTNIDDEGLKYISGAKIIGLIGTNVKGNGLLELSGADYVSIDKLSLDKDYYNNQIDNFKKEVNRCHIMNEFMNYKQ